MAHVLVVGGSRGVGLASVKAAIAAGHRVRAFARTAWQIRFDDSDLEKLDGDALSATDVGRALEDVDVVIQTLGVRGRDLLKPVTLFSQATRVLIQAMQQRGVKRLIALTGFGAGESRDAIGSLQRAPFLLIFGRAYADKDVQEHLIKDSGLAWTIARPGVLLPGPATGRYRILVERAQWRNGIVSRADVADFLVAQITSSQYVGQAPVLVR